MTSTNRDKQTTNITKRRRPCVLSKGFEAEFFRPFDIRIQDPLRWSWSILFQVSINQKLNVLNTFCPSIKRRKMDGRK